jgi:hypothetical protein
MEISGGFAGKISRNLSPSLFVLNAHADLMNRPVSTGNEDDAIFIESSPPPTAKRPKFTAPDDHSRCKLHLDYEGRRKICNAQTYAKNRCKYKVYDSEDIDALWESGFLPVCYIHRYSRVRRGECQATANCGQKCSRPCVFEPGRTQLCSRHKDEVQDCHLSKLPTELRLQIFELLVPAGPVPAKATHAYDPITHVLMTEKKYGTAASLMLVDKQTCADVSALLYQCPARPFEIEVSAASIGFGKIGWYDIPSTLVSPSHTSKHINSLSKCHLERIRHLKIKINANRVPQRLFSLLVNIRKLRQALKNDSAGNAEELQLGDNAATSSLAKLDINLIFEEYEPGSNPDFYPSEVLACARLILQLFRNLPVKFRWCIEWKIERARRYSTAGANVTKDAQMTLSNKKSVVKNMKFNKEDYETEVEAFRSWAKKCNSKFISTVLVSTWQQFKELESMVADLMNLKLLRDDHGHKSFMHDARVALETRDSEALDAMKSQLRKVSQEFVAAKMALLQKVQQKFLLNAPEDGEYNTDEVLHDPSSFMSWPMTTKKKLYLGEPFTVLWGTLEKHIDGGRTVYQPITPNLVRDFSQPSYHRMELTYFS